MKNSIFVVVLAVFLAACSPTGAGDNGTSYPNVSYPNVGPSTVDLSQITPVTNEEGENVVMPPPGQRDSQAKLIHDISLDVSKRSGADISEVTLVKIEEVVWPDHSLGCPAPDVMYAQALVDGFRVVVKLEEKEYTYHTNGLRSFVWCNDGVPVEPVK